MIMKLIILTKSTFFVEEDKILNTLFNEGMDNLHLYKPMSVALYSERLLSLLSEDYCKKITIHDHYHLKNKFNLAGIHLDNATKRIPIGYNGRIGRTCNNITTLKEFRQKSDYIFLKNIFDCIEFKNEKSNFCFKQLEKASQMKLIDKHVYALGGMNIEHAKIAKMLGFGGIVICGDLWQYFDIHKQADLKKIITHFEKLRRAIN